MLRKLFATLIVLNGWCATASADDYCQTGDAPPQPPPGSHLPETEPECHTRTVAPPFPVYSITPPTNANSHTVAGTLVIMPEDPASTNPPMNEGDIEGIATYNYVRSDNSYQMAEKRITLRRVRVNNQLKYQIHYASPDGNYFDYIVPRTYGNGIAIDFYYIWSGSGGTVGNVNMCFASSCQPSHYGVPTSLPLRIGRVNGSDGSDNNDFNWFIRPTSS